MSYGGSCDTQRVWGVCACADGQSLPGCLVNDSSTWLRLGGGGAQEGETLPPGLSVTCQVLPPPSPAAPAPAAGQPGGAAPQQQEQQAAGGGGGGGGKHLSGAER